MTDSHLPSSTVPGFTQIFRFFAPCPRGLEEVLAAELTQLGGQGIQPLEGGVAFRGNWLTLMKANLESRIASRILWLLAEKNYHHEKDIYQLAKSVDWEDLFQVQHTIKVNVSAIRSPLNSLDFVGLTVKDAICDHFRTKNGERPSVDTSRPDMRIHLFLTDKQATLYLDTSGEPLFKRGYRIAQGEAPLRENLAAGILALTQWQPTEALYDPMCGSGTFLIEAAQMALNWAPGRLRQFAFEKMVGFNAKQWAQYRAERLSLEKPNIALPIYGSDLSSDMIICSQQNLEAAGLAEVVTLTQADMLECSAPALRGVLVTNPPYGVRLSDQQALDVLYPQLGHVLKQRFVNWRAYFLSADPMLAKTIRLAASKRTPLFNGGLECRLLEYHLISGSNRKR